MLKKTDWAIFIMIFLIMIGIIMVFVVDLSNLNNDFINKIGFFVLLLGWLLFLIKVLYNRWTPLYFWIQRLKMQILNDDTLWNFSILYEGNIKEEDLVSLVNEIIKRYPQSCKIKKQTQNDYKFSIGKWLDFEIVLSKEHGLPEEIVSNISSLNINLFHKTITFRKTMNVLKKELCPIVDILDKNIKYSKKLYTLNVEFQKPNPYFGLFVKRLSLDEVSDFDISINLNNSGNVTVTKEKVIINTDTFHSLLNISNEYLTLSPEGVMFKY